MADLAESRGIHIDDKRLTQALKSQIVRTVASSGKGIPQLVDAILQAGRVSYNVA
jgi:Fe2+ transport system protein B